MADQTSKKRGMFTYAEFSTLWRNDQVGFWKRLQKSCSCDPADVRFEGGYIECGVCNRRLMARK